MPSDLLSHATDPIPNRKYLNLFLIEDNVFWVPILPQRSRRIVGPGYFHDTRQRFSRGKKIISQTGLGSVAN